MIYQEKRRFKGWDARRVRGVGLAGLLAFASVWGAHRAEQRATGSLAAEPTNWNPVPVLEPTAMTAAAPARVSWDLPNLDHPRVDYWVRAFSTRKRSEFARYLSRSGRYVPMISAKLEERGMPQDLIFLAMIESGFSPKAYSHAHASGLWQFIAETGRRYGLEVNRAVDERNDPEKATDAALRYLSELHQRFGSWYLAAAAYNSGENRVARIMREETGSEKGDEQSYYEIWNRLPRETRDYVPLMIAAARIAKQPDKYGFDDVEIEAPLAYDEVTVGPATPLANIAKAAGTTVKEIQRLNPELKLQRTRNDERSVIRIPEGSESRFAAAWPKVKAERLAAAEKRTTAKAKSTRRASARTYRVRNGDSLWEIARRNGTSVRALKRANNLRGNAIRPGKVLRIPA